MIRRGETSVPGWLPIMLLLLLFGLPFVIAAWLYYGDSLHPSGRSNHGAVLDPLVDLQDAVPESQAVRWSENLWRLIYRNDGNCGAECRESLYTLRQSRLMLGKDMNRLRRVFLHGDSAPDKVFLEQQHQGLEILRDDDLSEVLAASRPRDLAAGGFFLVDPLGNLVMYFPPDIAPGDMVEDIEHLLDLSRIG
ncbi:MAG: hypothetical protein WD448_08305 [Woeseia sp.]